jgi:carboxyl-terminal processing protease
MKKLNNKIRRYFVIIAFVITAGLTFSFVDNYFEVSKNLDIYATLFRELNLYYVDETNPGDLMTTSIEAMLKSLDPYTNYIPESAIEDFRFTISGEYGGIGATIGVHNGEITVSAPYEGFPAEQNGIMSGDILVAVDGQSVVGKSTQDVSKVLKGSAGTSVTLKFLRQGQDVEVTLDRMEIKIPAVPYYGMLEDKVGYIKLTSFTQSSGKEVADAFRALKDEGMEKVVLDLRGNGGGLLRQSVNIVNLFVAQGQTIVETKGRIDEQNTTHATLNVPLDTVMPVAVLVDGNSASASEIVSGALQDLDRAVIIGRRTYGKGLVQQTVDLSYGTKLKLTIAKYYIPSGRCIQKLDYSNRNESGTVEEFADSTIAGFKTKNGRDVFDGRGVDPDVEIDPGKYGNITAALMIQYLVFDYATAYRHKIDSIVKAEDFRMGDDEYQKFVTWVDGKDFEYDTRSEGMLDKLKELAEDEQYYDVAQAEFEALKMKLEPNQQEDFRRFKDEIVELLEAEIVSRYYYQNGRIENTLSKDPYLDEAIKVLNDGSRYNGILSGSN